MLASGHMLLHTKLLKDNVAHSLPVVCMLAETLQAGDAFPTDSPDEQSVPGSGNNYYRGYISLSFCCSEVLEGQYRIFLAQVEYNCVCDLIRDLHSYCNFDHSCENSTDCYLFSLTYPSGAPEPEVSF